jgi:hypothetical protein
MEQQILEIIEEEVSRRVSLALVKQAEAFSKTYDIPIEQIMKESSKIECTFCKGLLKSKKRCMKQPKENGYCGFHQSQVPPPAPRAIERVKAPWEN